MPKKLFVRTYGSDKKWEVTSMSGKLITVRDPQDNNAGSAFPTNEVREYFQEDDLSQVMDPDLNGAINKELTRLQTDENMEINVAGVALFSRGAELGHKLAQEEIKKLLGLLKEFHYKSHDFMGEMAEDYWGSFLQANGLEKHKPKKDK